MFFLSFASRRGYQLLKEGKLDDGLMFFTNLSKRFPRAAQPLYEVGKLQFKKGDLAAARATLLGVLERSPKSEIITGILEMTNWWMLSSPNFFNTTPCFSPDGKKLLFCSARQDTNGDGKIDAADRAGIYIADIASGEVTEIVPDTYSNASPIWSPDGQSILYCSSRPIGTDTPAPEDMTHRQLLLRALDSREDQLVVPASLNPRYPVFTPDGQRIVVCTVDSIGGPSGLSVVDLTTRVRRTLTTHAWEHTFPQVSADGKWLLYVSWRGTGASPGRPALASNPAVYLMNLDTEKEKVLIDNTFSSAYPRFSPQGDAVLVLSRRRDTNADGKVDQLDNFGVYTLRLSDRAETCVLSDDHYNKFAAWSADGRWILSLGHWATQKNKPSWQGEGYFEFKGLYRTPAQGGVPRAIVSDKYFGSRFCEVSPQGSLVAYVSWRPKTNRGLYVADYLNPPTLDQLRSFVQNNLS